MADALTPSQARQQAKLRRRQIAIRLIEIMRGGSENFFALLEAARSARILHFVREAGTYATCLYEGKAAEDFADVAAYLIEFERGSEFLEQLLFEGWGEGWGIYLSTPVDLDELRGQLRRRELVRLPDGETAHFRFQDPAVLHAILSVSTPEEIKTLLGPISAAYLESDDGKVVHRWTSKSGSVVKVDLESPANTSLV